MEQLRQQNSIRRRRAGFVGGLAVAGLSLALAAPAWVQQQNPREVKVRGDKARVEAGGYWLYNNLNSALAEAKKSGKPVLAIVRCIPCEACAKLDEQVVELNPEIRALLDKFVCVRLVTTNGMDLSLFQYDFDQSWTALTLNADRTIYGRYGTRSHQTESDQDITLSGFRKSLEKALQLHAAWPRDRAALQAKTGPKPPYPSPDKMPIFKDRPASLNYEGTASIVKDCIHCHQVGEALRKMPREAGLAIPEQAMFPYPNPRTLGFNMDPLEAATVKAVTAGSPAGRAGLKAGDEIQSLNGQPILSTADIQWVLHHLGEPARLQASVLRGGTRQKATVQMELASGWRRGEDLSWRASTWDLRRMATGGIKMDDLTDAERAQRGLGKTEMALLIKHVGQFGPHALAMREGFKKDDLIVSIDGSTARMTETDVLVNNVQNRKPGARVPTVVVRGGQRLNLMMPVQ